MLKILLYTCVQSSLVFSTSDWFILACSLSSMKRASSLNVLNMGGKATEDRFQVRSPIIFLRKVDGTSRAWIAELFLSLK